MNFSDFRVFRTFDTLPFKRLLLHIFQKTNNIEVVFVPEDVDGAREMVETIIFRVCISQGYPSIRGFFRLSMCPLVSPYVYFSRIFQKN